MARNNLPVTHNTFCKNKMQKLFLVRFRYCHCCFSIIMWPLG